MGESVDTAGVWIRPEDADHPKLERLRRVVAVSIGPDADVSVPWLVWGNALPRSWLFGKLESRAQVLILPPWPESGFAGLPAIRTEVVPSSHLSLQDKSYAVGAICAMEQTPAWQAHGLFVSSKLAWLVTYEPFVGAGRAWLCTAELLITSPTTRPREARRLTGDLLAYLMTMCHKKQTTRVGVGKEPEPLLGGFSCDDVPYLLAVLALPGIVDAERTAQFMHRRLGVEPDMAKVQQVLTHPDVQAALAQSLGARTQLAQVVDNLGFRSYRLEIEETAL